MNSLDLQIEEIIAHFDWRRVKEVMDFLNWRWATTDGVPEIEDLQRCARSLLDRLVKDWDGSEGWRSMSTGGLKARIDVVDDLDADQQGPCLSLSFELASYAPVE